MTTGKLRPLSLRHPEIRYYLFGDNIQGRPMMMIIMVMMVIDLCYILIVVSVEKGCPVNEDAIEVL